MSDLVVGERGCCRAVLLHIADSRIRDGQEPLLLNPLLALPMHGRQRQHANRMANKRREDSTKTEHEEYKLHDLLHFESVHSHSEESWHVGEQHK